MNKPVNEPVKKHMDNPMHNSITLYQSKTGTIELDIKFDSETLWLSQEQMGDLFNVGRQAVTKHLKNIFKTQELIEEAVCSKMEHTAKDGKTYQTKFYNLDAVISVGYRVNSTEATRFRIWATGILKEHLVRGYSLYDKRLEEKGIEELQQSIELLQKTLIHQNLVTDVGAATLQLITQYAKTWHVLRAYDEGILELPERGGGAPMKSRRSMPSIQGLDYGLDYKMALRAIDDLKTRLKETSLFGHEYSHGLQSILGNIEQTFDGEVLYKTGEERAAHLLYFIIKDHPFSDGNKRIGCLLFLLYLKIQNISPPFNENGLIALALLVAESSPQQRDLMVRLIVNLLIKGRQGEGIV
jgi:prophage maintenance system killer protein